MVQNFNVRKGCKMPYSYSLVIVVAPNDTNTLIYSMPFLVKYLPIKNIRIIGNKKVYDILDNKNVWQKDNRIDFIDEEQIIKLCDVKETIKRIAGDEESYQRAGWYLQQFIKMKYAFLCEEEYYIVWDADTIPLQKKNFFENERPVFFMKDEYNVAYFETMPRLVEGLKKIEDKSFIAEHMIINSKVMRAMIDEIESTNAEGKEFWEKILHCINPKDIKYSGYSEFETYGNYCMLRYPDLYVRKMYDSFRYASKYFVLDEMRQQDFEWIARDYPAVSFEKMMKPFRWYKMYQNSFLQKCFHIKNIYEFRDNIERFYKRVRNKIKK